MTVGRTDGRCQFESRMDLLTGYRRPDRSLSSLLFDSSEVAFKLSRQLRSHLQNIAVLLIPALFECARFTPLDTINIPAASPTRSPPVWEVRHSSAKRRRPRNRESGLATRACQDNNSTTASLKCLAARLFWQLPRHSCRVATTPPGAYLPRRRRPSASFPSGLPGL